MTRERLRALTMSAGPYDLQWGSLPGAAICQGCLGRIETGKRAVQFRRGPRELRRMEGQWFHSFDCLARRAEEDAAREEGSEAWRAEAFYDLERWARSQARERRMQP